jgi:hypothetical protein
MQATISRQALACLEFFVTHPNIRINHRTLMDQGLSKRKSYAILKELREANLVKMVKYVGGGTTLKVVESDSPTVVESGNSYIAVQLVSSISNSYTARTTNIATNKFLDRVEGKGIEMGWDFFEGSSSSDDDLVREREKHMVQKKAEYVEAREKKAQQRKDMHRSKLDPINWTCKDVAYEFADRMADIWSIAPFSVTQSRFVQALAGFRKQHDTNGALEIEIVNMFFSSLQAEKYTDGNHLWRAFMYKAPLLLQSAKERVVSVEEIETAIIRDQETTSKKLSLLDEDDDV